jgi:hypothetical protein
MATKIISSLLFLFSFVTVIKAQPINVNNISTTGRFNTCNASVPIVTATPLLPGAVTLINGAIKCTNPNDSTIIKISISNLFWNQNAGISWIHGIFLPTNANLKVYSFTTVPSNNWLFSATGCTGACPTGGMEVGGSGIYYAGNSSSCCVGGGTTASNPCDNWGDPFFNCSIPITISFDLTIKNSFISNNIPITIKATSDGNTGCWNQADAATNNLLSFQLEGIPCTSNSILCNPVSNSSLITNLAGPYQWQRSTDSVQFNNIVNGINYGGTNNSALNLYNIPSNRYGEQFRCIANGIIGEVFTLKFSNTWTGAVNNDWNNVGNWSCGTLPDQYTDVIINAGSVIVSTNTTIRSLSIQPTATITTNAGAVLTILH